jgi:hypothetical protein
MEAMVRKPFQGVSNIIRFNWHFYAIAIVVIAGAVLAGMWNTTLYWVCNTMIFGIILLLVTSLAISYYVYDYSPLYQFEWLAEFAHKPKSIINIHAGFDETSQILAACFPNAKLTVFDFYDPERHTELSIRRARKAYPEFSNTINITTEHIPVLEQPADLLFNIFALHEIRDGNERVNFLKEQRSALSETGRCFVVEHLRDVRNFLAYNIGFFHFFPESEWTKTFIQAGLTTEDTIRVTPFVKVFILKK